MPSMVDEKDEQLTIHYVENEDGWITAQIEQVPAAISQGATPEEARVNVLDALHDLMHRPTVLERIAYTLQARLVDPLAGLLHH